MKPMRQAGQLATIRDCDTQGTSTKALEAIGGNGGKEGDTLHYFTKGDNQAPVGLIDRALTERLNRELGNDACGPVSWARQPAITASFSELRRVSDS
jgi:hypothetical protein